jgi:membrane protease YdiL (CAAX protease family)
MKRQPLNGPSENRSPLRFFLLVFVLSIPFWLVGAVAERFLAGELQMNLPISSLSACCPIIAAVILVRREEGSHAVKTLLKRAFDYQRIKGKIWYVPILFLMPALMVLEYGFMRLTGVPVPDPQIPVSMVLIVIVVAFVEALGEEVGWQGYATEPLQARWNALTASLVMGIVWATWHIVLLAQMGRTPTWIAWQCMFTVVSRILYVWLYNGTGKSVFAVVLFHAMSNVSTFLFPDYGSHYDPLVTCVIVAAAAATVTFLWGPRTLAHYRYARRGGDVQAPAAGRPVPEAGA